MSKAGFFLALIALAVSGMAEPAPLNRNLAADSGWTISRVGATHRDQVLTLIKAPDSKAYPAAFRMLEVVPGKAYELAFEYRADNVGAGGEVRLEFRKSKTGTVTPIVNYNTIWHPMIVPFTAGDHSLRLVFRVWPGEKPGSTLEFRNVILREAGELLPPWGKMASETDPWGYRFSEGAIKSQEKAMRWYPASGKSEFTVTTPEIWPEKDHQLVLAVKPGATGRNKAVLRWSLEPLDLHGKAVGEPVAGTLTLANQPELLDRKFQFPAATVQVRLRVQRSAGTPSEVEFGVISLKRLSKEK